MGSDDRCSWTDAKAAANFQKHAIAFRDLREVFDGRYILARQDRRQNYGEPRFNVLAEFRGLIINITFTPRQGKIHLISARVASRGERRVYAKAREGR